MTVLKVNSDSNYQFLLVNLRRMFSDRFGNVHFFRLFYETVLLGLVRAEYEPKDGPDDSEDSFNPLWAMSWKGFTAFKVKTAYLWARILISIRRNRRRKGGHQQVEWRPWDRQFSVMVKLVHWTENAPKVLTIPICVPMLVTARTVERSLGGIQTGITVNQSYHYEQFWWAMLEKAKAYLKWSRPSRRREPFLSRTEKRWELNSEGWRLTATERWESNRRAWRGR